MYTHTHTHSPATTPGSTEDMQVELVMLDPYVRAPLAADGNGTFTARFRAPDVYGVFKWVLDYQRRGLSRLHVTETVPIRPYFHNEYERFIFQVRVALGRERGQLLRRRHSGSRMPIPCALDPANRSQTHPSTWAPKEPSSLCSPPQAFPYYGSILGLMAAFFVLSISFLYSK